MRPFYMDNSVLYDELLRLCDEDREYLERELNLIELWEDFSRDQALQFLWSLRTYFYESYKKLKEQEQII